MKKVLKTYRGRTWLLALMAVLLIGVMWKKRLSSTVDHWRARSAMAEQLNGSTSTASRIADLRTKVASMDASLGDLTMSPDAVWQAVLNTVGMRNTNARVHLHDIQAELTSEEEGSTLRILPLTLEGPFPDLLRTANELQRSVPEAHAISIHFHTERASFERPEKLLMTLYLQKIVRHA